MTPTQHTTSAAYRGLCKAIACALAELDGYDPKDEHGGLYDLRWSGGPNPEPEGDAWHMDYLPKAEKIAKALAASAPVAPAPQADSQPAPVPTRAFLERTLAAMEGVIDVADRQTDEFEALRSCVIDLTVLLFSKSAPARDYPPLPMQFACSGVFPVYSADQMRAYADETYALRIGAKHA